MIRPRAMLHRAALPVLLWCWLLALGSVQAASGAWSAAQEKVRRGLSKVSLTALNQLVKEIDSLAA